jgi:methylenetetrahydrofolate dehydrogenase (NADP+)/methenyltetrahydrofolate cyclohydrolase
MMSTAIMMDGRVLRDETVATVRAALDAAGSPPVCLATVLVGDDAPSAAYVRSKHVQADKAGLRSRNVELPATASQDDVESTVAGLAADSSVHGILVQLPLPGSLDAEAVIDLIPPEKDVDGLTERSMGRLVRGRAGLVPCTPLGVLRLIERYAVPTSGRRAVVVGRSLLVGLPMALLLARKGVDATVTIAHSRTADLAEVCRQADILVAAAGQPAMISAEHVRPGAAVFDVGTTRTEHGLAGDVDHEAVAPIAGWLTPMPGGTGPMTVACLVSNTLDAARLQGVLG